MEIKLYNHLISEISQPIHRYTVLEDEAAVETANSDTSIVKNQVEHSMDAHAYRAN